MRWFEIIKYMEESWGRIQSPLGTVRHSETSERRSIRYSSVTLPAWSQGLAVIESLGPVWLFCDPMDCSPPGSFIHGISWARILEWITISFSRRSSPHQAPLSIGFLKQEHQRGLPFPSPGYLPHPGIEPVSPALAELPLSHVRSQGIPFYWKMETPALHGVRWAVVTEIHSHGLEMCFQSGTTNKARPSTHRKIQYARAEGEKFQNRAVVCVARGGWGEICSL